MPDTTTDGFSESLYRFSSLQLQDPHIYDLNCSTDITSLMNGAIEDAITSDQSPNDGNYDLSVLLSLDGFELAEGHTGLAQIGSGNCDIENLDCYWTSFQTTTYQINLDMPCTEVDPQTLNYGSIASISPPCVLSPPGDLVLWLQGGIEIPLSMASVSAEFESPDDPAISNGLISGFLSESVAAATMFPDGIPFVGGRPLSEFLCRDDDLDNLDGVEGWWVYFVFQAVEWS